MNFLASSFVTACFNDEGPHTAHSNMKELGVFHQLPSLWTTHISLSSILTLMPTHGVWVASKQESKNFQLEEQKSVGSCEGIDRSPSGCHLHLSTISNRRSGRPLFLPTLLTTLQIGILGVWLSSFLLSINPTKFVSEWLNFRNLA